MQPRIRRIGAFFSAGALPATPNVKITANAELPWLETDSNGFYGVAAASFRAGVSNHLRVIQLR